MELVLFIGIPATGKSSFYRERFFRTHVRLNLDMLKSRRRAALLLNACLEGKTKVVIDNTNLTREERAAYIAPAKATGFRVIGFFFRSRVSEALARNALRPPEERVPAAGIHGASGRLALPSYEEGFERLYFVRMNEPHGFLVEDWKPDLL